MKQIKGLDTLRAFAVICVIIAHWGPLYYENEPVGKFIKDFFVPDGATGVYIFFTLSGFLITSILLNARFATNNPDRFGILKNFVVRRTLRIFPLYYIFMFAIMHVFDFPDVKQNLPWFLTYTSNILCYKTNNWNSASHTWTLAIEEQFYLFWPWLILFLNEKYLKYLFIVSIITGVITTYIVLRTKMEPFMVYNCIDSFAIGGFYSYARLNAERTRKFEKIVKWSAPFSLAIYFMWKISYFELHQDWCLFMKKTVDSMLALWLIVLIIKNKSERVRKYLLENRVLNFVGKVSYCIYLIHPYLWQFAPKIIGFIRASLPNSPKLCDFLTGNTFMYCINLAIVLLISWLSYTLIEKPILSLKRFFKYSKTEV